MMALTHGFVSLALATVLLRMSPELVAVPVLVAAFVGGLAPDLDIVCEHRKTFHFPFGYTLAAGFVAVAYLFAPSSPALVALVAVSSAAVHCLSDILAGSVERAPWNPTNERAVYNHVLRHWHRPRRWVRYSGAPEDVLAASVCSFVTLQSPTTGSVADTAVGILFIVAVAYTVVRHPSIDLRRYRSRLPAALNFVLPTIHIEETDSGATTVTLRRQ